MAKQSKTIVFTGGGSTGHVSVNLALIPYFLEHDWIVEYIGSTGSAVEYKGKFSNPLKFKEGGGILFKDGKTYSLDKGGKVEQNGCENTPCVSDLGDEMR